MALQLHLGLGVIQSYRRLSYTPWHAIAELVDNATQSYADHRQVLAEVLDRAREDFVVGIVYERGDGGTSEEGGVLRVTDNAMGMSFEELERALHVGLPPANRTGRSRYGMGMKTASCWIGNKWTVRTKKLGETTEHTAYIDVDAIANGNADLRHVAKTGRDPGQHYTVIEIRKHNQSFRGRTLGKIKDFLRSMYRQDIREGSVRLEWMGSPLEWNEADLFEFLEAPDGSQYRRAFEFAVGEKAVRGWVGVLKRGSRARAGFSILHANRVVRGWPDSWRPESLYGQIQGSNDLINQRLVGEIHLDEFEVSHTKDDILWFGEEEGEVQAQLKDRCGDYVEVAKKYRRRADDNRGPSEVETTAAIDELERELASAEVDDFVTLEVVPPPDAVAQAFRPLKRAVERREPTFRAKLTNLEILGFLVSDGSVNDPYVGVDSTEDDRVMVIVNVNHPHWLQLKGSDGVLNYLRHCTFDGMAEWQARRRTAGLDSDTIKVIKDKLLRLSLEIEMHQAGEGGDEVSGG